MLTQRKLMLVVPGIWHIARQIAGKARGAVVQEDSVYPGLTLNVEH